MKLKVLFFLIAFALNSLAHGEQHSNDQETDEQIEKMQSLIEMQRKTLESMSISLPLLTNPIMGMVEKLQELNEKEFASVHKQTSDLEAKVEEAINLIETKKLIRAKIKVMSIKWTPIGRKEIDEEKSAHFNAIREELLNYVDVN